MTICRIIQIEFIKSSSLSVGSPSRRRGGGCDLMPNFEGTRYITMKYYHHHHCSAWSILSWLFGLFSWPVLVNPEATLLHTSWREKKRLPFHPWLERCGSRSGCNAKTLCSLVWYLIGDHCLQLLMPFDFFDYLMDHDCVLICFFIGMQIQLARPPVVPTSKNSSRYKEEGGQSMCNKIRIIYFSFSAATPLVIFIRKHAA